jgi:hypothetical protein
MLIGWCACGCFAPWTNIATVQKTNDYITEILQISAKNISQNSDLALVTLADDATLSDMKKSKEQIRITTQGVEKNGLVKIVLEDGRQLFVTKKHPLLTDRGAMIIAKDLKFTDKLVDINGTSLVIRSLSSVPYNGLVYNFATSPAMDTKEGHIVFAEGLAVGDLYWQASLEDEINRIFIRK